MKVTQKELEVLAHGYDSGFWRVFRKVFLEQRQMELAQAAPFAPNMEAVAETRGKIMELLHIEKEMKSSHKKATKNED
jgi:hypothetical protein